MTPTPISFADWTTLLKPDGPVRVIDGDTGSVVMEYAMPPAEPASAKLPRPRPPVPPEDLERAQAARAWRESLGIGQRTLGLVIGYSQSMIADYERGYRLREAGNHELIPASVWRRYSLVCTGFDAVRSGTGKMAF